LLWGVQKLSFSFFFFKTLLKDQLVIDESPHNDAEEPCSFYQVYIETFWLEFIVDIVSNAKGHDEAKDPYSCCLAHDYQASGQSIVVLGNGDSAGIRNWHCQDSDNDKHQQYPVTKNFLKEHIETLKVHVSFFIIDAELFSKAAGDEGQSDWGWKDHKQTEEPFPSNALQRVDCVSFHEELLVWNLKPWYKKGADHQQIAQNLQIEVTSVRRTLF
jgi:hypothetical protein